MLFSAVAESGDDTYHDGLCAGAAIGMLRPDGELDWIRPLDPPAKVEGLEVDRAGSDLALLMVADPDDPAIARTAARRAPRSRSLKAKEAPDGASLGSSAPYVRLHHGIDASVIAL